MRPVDGLLPSSFQRHLDQNLQHGAACWKIREAAAVGASCYVASTETLSATSHFQTESKNEIKTKLIKQNHEMTEASFPTEVLGRRLLALCQRASQFALLASTSQSWRGLPAHISESAHWDDAPLGGEGVGWGEPNSGVYCVSVSFCVKQKRKQYALNELHKGAKPKALVPQSLDTRSAPTQVFKNQSSRSLEAPEPSAKEPSICCTSSTALGGFTRPVVPVDGAV